MSQSDDYLRAIGQKRRLEREPDAEPEAAKKLPLVSQGGRGERLRPSMTPDDLIRRALAERGRIWTPIA